VSKLETIHWISQPIICIVTAQICDCPVIATQKFIRDSTTERECAKQNAFQPWRKTFQMVNGAWRESMTALFKILWRMKHTV